MESVYSFLENMAHHRGLSYLLPQPMEEALQSAFNLKSLEIDTLKRELAHLRRTGDCNWRRDEKGEWRSSCLGTPLTYCEYIIGKVHFNFCPNCGKKVAFSNA